MNWGVSNQGNPTLYEAGYAIAFIERWQGRWFLYTDFEREGRWHYTDRHFDTEEAAKAMAVALYRLDKPSLT